MIEKIKRILHRGALFVLHGVPRITIEAKVLQVHTSELLKSHVVLITGGSSGIGKAIAKACLESGAKVIITGRHKEKLSSLVSKLREISTAVYALPLDNNDVKNMKDAIIEAEKLAGAKLTTLINNAGIALGSFDHLEEKEFEMVLDTNIKGTVFLSKYFSEYLRQNNIKGNILNMVSSSGFRPAVSAYEISKWGLRGFTAGLAKKLIPFGIVVNGIAPGPTATPMLKRSEDNNLLHPTNPSGRYTTPEEVASLAVYLISDMARQIVGDVVCMTGGAGTLTYDDIKY